MASIEKLRSTFKVWRYLIAISSIALISRQIGNYVYGNEVGLISGSVSLISEAVFGEAIAREVGYTIFILEDLSIVLFVPSIIAYLIFRRKINKKERTSELTDNSLKSEEPPSPKLKRKFVGPSNLATSIIVITSIFLLGALFFGLFDKFFIRRSFEKAFFYRTVGNCEEFVNYVAKDKEKWLDRCIKEKKREDAIPINSYKILRVDTSPDSSKAFLQVELTRDKETRALNYEMIKEGFKWKITNEI